MKHDREFRALVTTFDAPESIDDCTIMYARPDHEDDSDPCRCRQDEPQLLDHSCGELRCRKCGRRVA